MLERLKKFAIIVTIAVLFTIFIFAMTNAFYPKPDYGDFCKMRLQKPYDYEKCRNSTPEQVICNGDINYTYGADGCPVSMTCDGCGDAYQEADKKYEFVLFLVSSIAGLIAILFGIFFARDNDFWDVTKGGFLLGGLASLFIGTGIYYSEIARFLKPAIILAEMIIVILIAYKLLRKNKR